MKKYPGLDAQIEHAKQARDECDEAAKKALDEGFAFIAMEQARLAGWWSAHLMHLQLKRD